MILLQYTMNDLPLELLEMVLMRSFLMLYLSDYETDDYVHSTTEMRPRRLTFSLRRDRDRDVPTFLRDQLETETPRPRLHPCVIVLVIHVVIL